MDKSRLETKVGLFVFIVLALLALLMLQFSKSTSLWRGTYELHLHAASSPAPACCWRACRSAPSPTSGWPRTPKA
jgi:hypothetical protein